MYPAPQAPQSPQVAASTLGFDALIHRNARALATVSLLFTLLFAALFAFDQVNDRNSARAAVAAHARHRQVREQVQALTGEVKALKAQLAALRISARERDKEEDRARH